MTRPIKAILALSAAVSPAALATAWIAIELARLAYERRDAAEDEATKLAGALSEARKTADAAQADVERLTRLLALAEETALELDTCKALYATACEHADHLTREAARENEANTADRETAARLTVELEAMRARAEKAELERDEWHTMDNIHVKFLKIANRRRAAELTAEADALEAAPVEPVAAPAVICDWCRRSSQGEIYCVDNHGAMSDIEICRSCSDDAVRARYAARALPPVAAAEVASVSSIDFASAAQRSLRAFEGPPAAPTQDDLDAKRAECGCRWPSDPHIEGCPG